MQRLEQFNWGQEEFAPEVLDWIAKENLWNLWVPKTYGGLEMSLTEGLVKLKSLAKCDGSLGWTVTLCSGANFFVGNLQKEVANEIFHDPETPVCFGGSGGVFGTAEKEGDGYIISGIWKYATGAPYLTHFTLNAKIQEAGRDVLQADGTPTVCSFVLGKNEVEVIKDWNTMGLKPTATYSFKVDSKWVDGKYSFVYNEFHQPHTIFKVPFTIFADLTLWVNYIGMAMHFLEESQKVSQENPELDKFKALVHTIDAVMMNFAIKIQGMIEKNHRIPNVMSEKIHTESSTAIRSLSEGIIKMYSFLGISASKSNQPVNQVFRDYFTATQHHNFR